MARNEEHVLIIFLDDNDEKVDVWVELLEENPSFIKFRDSNGSVITLPIHRLLKIKKKQGGLDNE